MHEDVDDTGWDVEPGDAIEPVVQAVGRLLKVCREAAGTRVAELGEVTGYGEDMIRKMESGMRIPRHPPLSEDVIEREVAARMGRKAVFQRDPAPSIGFVQEQVTLERPIEGRMVLRRQAEHLLEVAQLRTVSLQVMPTTLEEHAGMRGRIHVLKFADGSAIGRSAGAFDGRPVESPKDLRILESSHGMIRAQALPPRESLAFVEQALGRL
ncbi:helix-turn-helix transcriptional regulator [Streptomyces sp. NPDC018347]|uniref:helix-turn-helix domain-containing protein n=1 Tax=Streptomyces sp. NPDC018347 TaxID=3157193 RepID=UPI0033D9A54A